MSDRFFCATAARGRADPLAGSAAPARRWLLVEYCGPWATLALQSPGLQGPVGRALHEAAVTVGGRVLLVRRTGRRRPRAVQRWAVVGHDEGQVWGSWRDPGDLLDAAACMRDAAAGPSGAVRWQTGEAPLLLVCTHGRHDACCAVRGRPVAGVLAARWPDQTWECSHVGGDRFAASILVLPDGTCYGGLDAASASAVVEGHLDGRVDPAHFRGQSTQPPVVQAVTAAALGRFSRVGPRDVLGATAVRLDADLWQVTLRCTGGLPPTLQATVTRSTDAPTQLTCRGRGDAAAYRYLVADLRSPT